MGKWALSPIRQLLVVAKMWFHCHWSGSYLPQLYRTAESFLPLASYLILSGNIKAGPQEVIFQIIFSFNPDPVFEIHDIFSNKDNFNCRMQPKGNSNRLHCFGRLFSHPNQQQLKIICFFFCLVLEIFLDYGFCG